MRSQRPRSHLAERAFGGIVLVACLASLAVFFRRFVFSGFDLLPGGQGDGRLLVAILEHWLNVFRGWGHAASPPFFAPTRGTLGYSESMFLFSLPYAGLRSLGLDRYVAYGVTLMVVRGIGFAAMYALLRRALGVDRWIALLGAALLTLSNGSYLAAGHTQLYAVGFVPLLGLLVSAYGRHHLDGRPARARGCLAGAMALLGLLLFTCFYVGWFVLLLAAVACGVGCLRAVARGTPIRPDPRLPVRGDVAVAVGALLIALAPFLAVYGPAYRSLGGHQFAEVLAYAPEPADAVAVGRSNLVWGHLVAELSERPDRSQFARFELERGWPPVLLLVFLVSLACFLRRMLRDRRAAVASIIGVTAVVGWMLSVRLGTFTPWRLLFQYVPAASAIRVPVRINAVLTVLIIAVGMLGLGSWKTAAAPHGRRALSSAALLVLAIVLVAEQLNAADTFRLSRARETALFDGVAPTPAPCRYFYMTAPVEPPDLMTTIGIQTEAMLVAVERHVRTFNGYSGNYPQGWSLFVLDAEYPQRVAAWRAAHRIPPRMVCSLDAATGRWSAPPPARVNARSRAPSDSPAPRR